MSATIDALASEEAAKVAAEFLAKGALDLKEYRHLSVGARVRNYNQVYFEARVNGTGTIERIFHRPDSSWQQKYGRDDVELIIRRDDGTYSYVADYHVALIEAQP